MKPKVASKLTPNYKIKQEIKEEFSNT